MSSFAETNGITDFFVRLGEDDSLLARFLRNPRAVLAGSGLDEQAIEVVLAGDLTSVQSAVLQEVESDPARRSLGELIASIIQWKKKKKGDIKPDDPSYPGPPTQPPPPPPTRDDQPGEDQGG